MSADPYSLLLENLAGGASGPADMQGLLAQLAETDPRAGLLAKYFAQRRAAEEAEAAESDDSEDEEDDSAAGRRGRRADSRELSGERAEAVRALQRMARSMYAELEVLRERNDMLAAALGACYLCWGEDFECQVCGGAGAPGSLPVDWSLFATLVAPAVRRLRKTRTVAPQAAPAERRAATGRATNPNEIPN